MACSLHYGKPSSQAMSAVQEQKATMFTGKAIL
jgi:hypothetical protein